MNRFNIEIGSNNDDDDDDDGHDDLLGWACSLLFVEAGK